MLLISSTTYADIILSITQFDSTQGETKRYQIGLDMGNDFSGDEVSIVLDKGLASELLIDTELVDGKMRRYVEFTPIGVIDQPSTVTLVVGNKKYLDSVNIEDFLGVSTTTNSQQYTIVSANTGNNNNSAESNQVNNSSTNASEQDSQDIISTDIEYTSTPEDDKSHSTVKLDDSDDRQINRNILTVLTLLVTFGIVLFCRIKL